MITPVTVNNFNRLKSILYEGMGDSTDAVKLGGLVSIVCIW
jgi:hypothetical protein